MKMILGVVCISLFGLSCTAQHSNLESFLASPEPNDGRGILYIYRTDSVTVTRSPDILINGEMTIDSPRNSYTWVHLDAGQHTLEIDWKWSVSDSKIALIVPIQEGQSHFIKISVLFDSVGNDVRLWSEASSIAEDAALKEIEDCCAYIATRVRNN